MTYGTVRAAFPDLDSQTLKHCRVVRLKFTPPLTRGRRSTPHQPASMAPASGMETITTGHFQSLACRHTFLCV